MTKKKLISDEEPVVNNSNFTAKVNQVEHQHEPIDVTPTQIKSSLRIQTEDEEEKKTPLSLD